MYRLASFLITIVTSSAFAGPVAKVYPIVSRINIKPADLPDNDRKEAIEFLFRMPQENGQGFIQLEKLEMHYVADGDFYKLSGRTRDETKWDDFRLNKVVRDTMTQTDQLVDEYCGTVLRGEKICLSKFEKYNALFLRVWRNS